MNNIFILLLLLLLGLMILVGGKTGLKSYLSIIINACLLYTSDAADDYS